MHADQAVVIRHFGAVQSLDSAERAHDVLLEATLAEHGRTQETPPSGWTAS